MKHNCPFECHQLLAVLSKVGKLQHNGILGHFRVGMHTNGFSQNTEENVINKAA